MNMQTTSLTPDSTTSALADRVAALELLVQNLVFMLDARGTLSAEDLQAWLHTATSRMHATGSVAPGPLAALRKLGAQVCE